jgi:hypothetical protein
MRRLPLLALFASIAAPLPPRRSDDLRLSPHPTPDPDPVRDFPRPAPAPVVHLERPQKARVAAPPVIETRQMRRAREREDAKQARSIAGERRWAQARRKMREY